MDQVVKGSGKGPLHANRLVDARYRFALATMKDPSSPGRGRAGRQTGRRPLTPAGAGALRELKCFLMKPMRDGYLRARSLCTSLSLLRHGALRAVRLEFNPLAEYGIMSFYR
jgi:hypothetical protein